MARGESKTDPKLAKEEIPAESPAEKFCAAALQLLY